jgi:hypothetical protein
MGSDPVVEVSDAPVGKTMMAAQRSILDVDQAAIDLERAATVLKRWARTYNGLATEARLAALRAIKDQIADLAQDLDEHVEKSGIAKLEELQAQSVPGE